MPEIYPGVETLDKTHDESRQGEVFYKEATDKTAKAANGRKFYVESYGCAMNFSDSEIVASILTTEGFTATRDYMEADVVLINTCSIRENAETKIHARLGDFKKIKTRNPSALIGIMGCMAERLKGQLLEQEKLVDIVVGPDAYRELPSLISSADDGQKAVNVLLSREETYSDINPVRLNSNGISAFISIMRGCDNMCSFCVVPFTRGRERSRDPQSIVKEAAELAAQGYKEVTLLGQNVDSYKWSSASDKSASASSAPVGVGLAPTQNAQALASLEASGADAAFGEAGASPARTTSFAQLLKMVAQVSPSLRVRFSTSHPKDITEEVMHAMNKYDNICKYIHLPLQSGSSRVLELMNRTYTREWYKDKIDTIRRIIPGCGISTDIITGFCSETEEEHQETLSMMEYVHYDLAYMFAYSERPGTLAARKYKDDVPDEVKSRRLTEIVDLQFKHQAKNNPKDIGKVYEVLAEGVSKKSKEELFGRTSHNKVIVFPRQNVKPGEYVMVEVTGCTQATLTGMVAGSPTPTLPEGRE